MEKITAFFLSVFTALNLFFGNAASPDYVKMTNLIKSIEVIFNKKEISSEQHIGTVSDYVWNETDEFTLDNTICLQKEKDRDFKILTISDVHFSDYGYRVLFSGINVNTIKRMVASTQPDLIILMGDFVCGDDSDYYSIQKITDLMESFGIPWAPIFGNHDDEVNCDLNFLVDTMKKSPHCLMQKGDPEMGVGNYIINIVEDENIVESLIMMDSHHNIPNEKQTKWFKWATEGIKKLSDNNAEVSLYMHIPLPEYQLAYDEAWNYDKKCWNDGYDAYGERNEKICCVRDENGNAYRSSLFEAVKASGNTKYIFCAHDHMNDFSIEFEGVRLTYMMKIGKCSGYQPGFSGGSVISVGSDGINRITHKTISYGPVINIVDINTKK